MRHVFLLVLLAGAALAAPQKKVVLDAPPPLKALLTNALKKKFTVVAPKEPLADELSVNEIKQAVTAAGAVAIVTAKLSNGVWSVMALNGADGNPLEQFRFAAGSKPVKLLPKGSDARLQKALAGARAPGKEATPKEEPVAEPKVEPKDEPAKEPKKSEPVRTEPKKAEEPVRAEPKKTTAEPARVEEVVEPAETSERPVGLRVGAGGRAFTRRFFYNQDLFTALSKYSLTLGPALVLDVDAFPAAFVSRGVAAHIGLQLGLTYAVGISSVATDGTKYGTSAVRLKLGLVGRIPLGRIELLPQAGWVLQTYAITSGGAPKPNIPAVSYSNLRFGLGSKITLFGPLSLTAGFAYQLPLSTGEIGSAKYFPRLSAGGLDANLGLAVMVGERIEIRGGVDYIRYWYTLNPQPGDPYVAGGALDDYRGANLTIGFIL